MQKKKQKLWGGRFRESTSSVVEDFTSSIHFDIKLYKHDIAGSIAHAEMLAEQGLISDEEGKKITKGLKEIEREIEEGRFKPAKEYEDIHMNIEARLIEKIGEPGRKLHTGRSRNDQVALDLRLYLREETKKILAKLGDLRAVLIDRAEENIETLLPGYTHLQRAMPVTLAHHLLAYQEMFRRDWQRFYAVLDEIDCMPLGSGAIAGTTLPINRKSVAEKLGFTRITSNSMDAVSDRDFALDHLYACALLMMHLSRVAEDFIIWSTQEFNFVTLPDRFATGSSMMPNKKNPDVLELIRGKSGRAYGNLVALLTVMKGLPLTYNRDMQEDKERVFDSTDTVLASLNVICELMKEIEFNKESMRGALDSSMLATDLAEYLVAKGVPFRSAHSTVGKIVRYATDNNMSIDEIKLAELKKFSEKISADVYKVLNPVHSLKKKTSYGSSGFQSILRQIKKGRETLKKERALIGFAT